MGNICKLVGYISKQAIILPELSEHLNKPILQSLKLYKHTAKHVHVEDFKNVNSHNKTMSHIDKIISKPDFIYYDKEKQSLRYYKLLDEYVCVIVKLSKKDNYIYIQFIQ